MTKRSLYVTCRVWTNYIFIADHNERTHLGFRCAVRRRRFRPDLPEPAGGVGSAASSAGPSGGKQSMRSKAADGNHLTGGISHRPPFTGFPGTSGCGGKCTQRGPVPDRAARTRVR